MKEYTTLELKALAYDQIANIEKAQANLKAINEELLKREHEQTIQTGSE